MASHWFLREARGNSRRVPWDISWGISSGIRSTFFSAWDHAVSHGIPWDIRTAMLSTIRRLGGRGNIWCQWRGVECRRLSKMVLKRKQTFRGASRKVLQYARSPVSYTHLRAHETRHDLVCRLLLEKKKRPESKEIKEIQEGSPTNNIIVGNHRLRRAERWENIPRVSSEVGEI